ncbi:Gp19/Gp15/Gp42 family protein [Lancefieldella parvula]|uniref:Gp19/Gp15/Gp42 family protein n=1 Tax=Lancefieldella parvula TaxID=1382 RepID=UPI0028E938D4|nr:Gp19/Gp15/Gp42 family protein [Lancefieldella parvula]
MAGQIKPFATLSDLKAMFPTLEATDEERAENLLSLISAAVGSLCEWESKDPAVLKLVVCQAAIRVLQAGEETPIGVTSQSWMAYPFTGSTSYANPTGDIYFTAFEKSLLGVDEGYAIFANPLPKED